MPDLVKGLTVVAILRMGTTSDRNSGDKLLCIIYYGQTKNALTRVGVFDVTKALMARDIPRDIHEHRYLVRFSV
jgi:hypothetical protein